MTKLMFALRGGDPTTLHSAALHRSLAAAGAQRLQLNVDDEHVAAAMRIPGAEGPVDAVVSVWSDGEVERVVDVLVGTAATVDGWEVEERRPIDPDERWDGSRLDGLANLALLRRPDELTHEEWLHRWLVDHTPVAIATQATFGYVQNVVLRPVTPTAAPVAALVEELFPSAGISDMHAFYGSGGDDAELGRRLEQMMASVARFGADRGIDLVPTSRYLHDLTTYAG